MFNAFRLKYLIASVAIAAGTAHAANGGPSPWIPSPDWGYEIRYVNAAGVEIVELPPVLVLGRRCADDAECRGILTRLQQLADTSMMNAVVGTFQSPDQGATNVVLIPSKFDKPNDVRTNCKIPGRSQYAKTTSRDDETMRHDAVTFIVGANQAFWAAEMVAGRLSGKTTSIGPNRYIKKTFIYADGGREDRYINAFLTNNNEPAGNLQRGDGVPKDADC